MFWYCGWGFAGYVVVSIFGVALFESGNLSFVR